tara:strand:- start:58 stop:249 length:192 start_codon:yes stop_codon:yes gene_type:complete
MTKTQANRAYIKMKNKLMERMGYDSIDLPTLKNVHPEFITAKERLIKACKKHSVSKANKCVGA